jgi:hypothetical protein
VIQWDVDRHAPRGFKFSGTVFMEQACPLGCVTFGSDISAQVCGEDPYAAQWNWRVQGTFADTVPGAEGSYTNDFTWTDPLTSATTHARVPGNPVPGPEGGLWRFIPGTGGNPQVEVTWTPDAGYQALTSTDQTVPVTEDMSCPAPAP